MRGCTSGLPFERATAAARRDDARQAHEDNYVPVVLDLFILKSRLIQCQEPSRTELRTAHGNLSSAGC